MARSCARWPPTKAIRSAPMTRGATTIASRRRTAPCSPRRWRTSAVTRNGWSAPPRPRDRIRIRFPGGTTPPGIDASASVLQRVADLDQQIDLRRAGRHLGRDLVGLFRFGLDAVDQLYQQKHDKGHDQEVYHRHHELADRKDWNPGFGSG